MFGLGICGCCTCGCGCCWGWCGSCGICGSCCASCAGWGGINSSKNRRGRGVSTSSIDVPGVKDAGEIEDVSVSLESDSAASLETLESSEPVTLVSGNGNYLICLGRTKPWCRSTSQPRLCWCFQVEKGLSHGEGAKAFIWEGSKNSKNPSLCWFGHWQRLGNLPSQTVRHFSQSAIEPKTVEQINQPNTLAQHTQCRAFAWKFPWTTWSHLKNSQRSLWTKKNFHEKPMCSNPWTPQILQISLHFKGPSIPEVPLGLCSKFGESKRKTFTSRKSSNREACS